MLIRSAPTAIAGVIALARVGSLREWELPDDDAWHQVFLEVLANAIDGNRPGAAIGRDGD